jgi:pimeloyl-ACP methyl ester carboxylesterase
MRLPGLIILVAGGLMAAGCSSPRASSDTASRIPLAPCHLDRLAEEVLCGSHEVFEDRAARAGRRLTVQIAVLPALRRAAEPDPLFILMGGPGQGARGAAPAVARYFKKIRRTREIVLVDLRGTGASAPLVCPGAGDELAALAPDVAGPADVARCLRGQGDPRQYTHASALGDLDEIRQRLGYRHINLWGGSWGTRAALLYTLTYPLAVRSVVLDGAVPLSTEFPRTVATLAERALQLHLAACEADAACAAAHSGARAQIAALLTRLDAGPIAISLRHPRTGAPTSLTLVRDVVVEMLRVMLYTPADAARLFQIVRHAANGDFGPLIAQFLRSASLSSDSMAFGQTLSVLCSEDLPLVDRADFDRDAAGTSFRASYAETWRRRCRAWPRGPAIAFDRGATTPVPALILSGEHDPVTPPASGEAMSAHFVNRLHVVVPGAAHNASFSGCVPDLIAEFIARGSTAPMDTSCAARIAWPRAVLDAAGGRP